MLSLSALIVIRCTLQALTVNGYGCRRISPNSLLATRAVDNLLTKSIDDGDGDGNEERSIDGPQKVSQNIYLRCLSMVRNALDFCMTNENWSTLATSVARVMHIDGYASPWNMLCSTIRIERFPPAFIYYLRGGPLFCPLSRVRRLSSTWAPCT